MINIPGYRLERELGIGGMATVFLAVQENLHRQVALKVMTPGLSVDETYCHRFLKEGRIAAQLSHANLLTVYDIGVHENHYYMASEYLSGGTVRSKMARLSTEEIVRIVSDIAKGLSYAHKKGFVHRDVKPGNLLFRANGDCVLADFGIAKSVDSNTGATKLGTSIGTPHYMSPEQAKGEKVDHRTDLYSLGVVFFEMLAKQPPFDADDPFSVALAQINDPIPKLPAAHDHFQNVIEKLMTKDQNFRYATAAEFLKDLDQFLGNSHQTSQGVSAVDQKSNSADERHTAKSKQRKRQPVNAKNSSSWMGKAGIGFLFIILVAAGVILGPKLFSGNNTDPNPTPDQPVVKDEPVKPEIKLDDRIDLELNKADRLIIAKQYFSPVSNNAYQIYQELLSEYPENDKVLLKIRELSNIVERTAEAAILNNQSEDAKTLLQRAIRHYPDDQGLKSMLASLAVVVTPPVIDDVNNTSVTDISNQPPELQSLLKDANDYFQAGQFISPPGKNATEAYLRILDLDPDNEIADQRLTEIADNWVVVAEDYLKQGEINIARRMIDKGLEAKPNYPKLMALKRQVDAQ